MEDRNLLGNCDKSQNAWIDINGCKDLVNILRLKRKFNTIFHMVYSSKYASQYIMYWKIVCKKKKWIFFMCKNKVKLKKVFVDIEECKMFLNKNHMDIHDYKYDGK